MKKILEKLACTFDGDDILAPTFRPDLVHKADIAEEIARFYGYNTIESAPLPGGTQGRLTPSRNSSGWCPRRWEALGADEIMTYSFCSPKVYDKLLLAKDDPRAPFRRDPQPAG